MRTTMTLDDDVAAQLRRLREESGVPFRRLVNDVLRRGLATLDAPQRRRTTAATRPVSLGGALLPGVDDVAEVLAIVEEEPGR